MLDAHSKCIVTINVLWLFLTVPRVGLQYVIVVFPDHTHFFTESQPQNAELRRLIASLISFQIIQKHNHFNLKLSIFVGILKV